MSSVETEFEKLEKTFLLIIKRKFDERLQRARNKDLVKKELIEIHLTQYHFCFTLNKYRKTLIESFQYGYERGHPVMQEIIDKNTWYQDIYKEHKKEMPDPIFGKANPKQIVRFFAKYAAYQTFLDFLSKEYPEQYANYEQKIKQKVLEKEPAVNEIEDDFTTDLILPPQPFKRTDNIISVPTQSYIVKDTTRPEAENNQNVFSVNSVKWKSKNKTEFVQFVYALFEAGLITNESGEVTKLVEQLATIFQFDLGSNWQSNHSKSINNRNNDYEPEIFDRIKKAYSAYTEELMQGIKKRKK